MNIPPRHRFACAVGIATLCASLSAGPLRAQAIEDKAVTDTTSTELFLTFSGDPKYFAEKVSFTGELSAASRVTDAGRFERYEFPFVTREMLDITVHSDDFTPTLVVTAPSTPPRVVEGTESDVRFRERSTAVAGHWTIDVRASDPAETGMFEVTVRRIAPARPTVRVKGGFCQTLELVLVETLVDNVFLLGEANEDGSFTTTHGLHSELSSQVTKKGLFDSLLYDGSDEADADRVFAQTVTAIGGCLGRDWTYKRSDWEETPVGRSRYARFVDGELGRIAVVTEIASDPAHTVRVTVLRDPPLAASLLAEQEGD